MDFAQMEELPRFIPFRKILPTSKEYSSVVCDRKKRYQSLHQARGAIRGMKEMGAWLHPYRCLCCGSIHLANN